jgi:hypothetical protein
VSPQASTSTLQATPSTPINQVIEPAAESSATGSNTGASSGSVEGSLRFRTLTDLFDTTNEIHYYEYSGVCMLAADEPAGVEKALEEKCWRDAMVAEL